MTQINNSSQSAGASFASEVARGVTPGTPSILPSPSYLPGAGHLPRQSPHGGIAVDLHLVVP